MDMIDLLNETQKPLFENFNKIRSRTRAVRELNEIKQQEERFCELMDRMHLDSHIEYRPIDWNGVVDDLERLCDCSRKLAKSFCERGLGIVPDTWNLLCTAGVIVRESVEDIRSGKSWHDFKLMVTHPKVTGEVLLKHGENAAVAIGEMLTTPEGLGSLAFDAALTAGIGKLCEGVGVVLRGLKRAPAKSTKIVNQPLALGERRVAQASRPKPSIININEAPIVEWREGIANRVPLQDRYIGQRGLAKVQGEGIPFNGTEELNRTIGQNRLGSNGKIGEVKRTTVQEMQTVAVAERPVLSNGRNIVNRTGESSLPDRIYNNATDIHIGDPTQTLGGREVVQGGLAAKNRMPNAETKVSDFTKLERKELKKAIEESKIQSYGDTRTPQPEPQPGQVRASNSSQLAVGRTRVKGKAPEVEELVPNVRKSKPAGNSKTRKVAVTKKKEKTRGEPTERVGPAGLYIPVELPQFQRIKIDQWCHKIRDPYLNKWGSKDLAGVSAETRRFLERIDKPIAKNMKPDDLAAFAKEKAGHYIPNGRGGFFNHIKEVEDAERAIVKHLNNINKRISKLNGTPEYAIDCEVLLEKWSDLNQFLYKTKELKYILEQKWVNH